VKVREWKDVKGEIWREKEEFREGLKGGRKSLE